MNKIKTKGIKKPKKGSAFSRLLNKMPSPFYMFMYITIFLVLLSAILGWSGVKVTYNDKAGVEQTERIKNMLSSDGIKWFFENMFKNFVNLGALPLVLITTSVVFVAERTGLLGYMLRRFAKFIPPVLLTPSVIFLGVMASLGTDVGYIVLIPLGGMIFYSMGRHPVAGIAAAFAGVSGGFSANLIVGPMDSLIAEIANDMIPAGEQLISTTTHWIVLIVATFTTVGLGWLVTSKWVEPKLNASFPYKENKNFKTDEITNEEKRAAFWATISLLGVIFVIAMLSIDRMWFGNAPLGKVEQFGTKTFGFVTNISQLIPWIILVPAVVYGKVLKSINKENTVLSFLKDGFKSTAGIVLMMFWIGQYVAIFSYTLIDKLFATGLANGLQAMNITNPVLLMIAFFFIVALVNILVSGMSSKLYLIGSIFIPTFINLGVDAKWTLFAYRLADSSTNIIAPLMSYFPMIIGFALVWIDQDKLGHKFGIGDMVRIMTPYSIAMVLMSLGLILLFWYAKIPLGF